MYFKDGIEITDARGAPLDPAKATHPTQIEHTLLLLSHLRSGEFKQVRADDPEVMRIWRKVRQSATPKITDDENATLQAAAIAKRRSVEAEEGAQSTRDAVLAAAEQVRPTLLPALGRHGIVLERIKRNEVVNTADASTVLAELREIAALDDQIVAAFMGTNPDGSIDTSGEQSVKLVQLSQASQDLLNAVEDRPVMGTISVRTLGMLLADVRAKRERQENPPQPTKKRRRTPAEMPGGFDASADDAYTPIAPLDRQDEIERELRAEIAALKAICDHQAEVERELREEIDTLKARAAVAEADRDDLQLTLDRKMEHFPFVFSDDEEVDREYVVPRTPPPHPGAPPGLSYG